MYKALNDFFELLFPPKCICCGAFLPRRKGDAALCPSCLKEWEKEKSTGRCRTCGQFYPLCGCDARRITNPSEKSVFLVGYDLSVEVPARLILMNKTSNRSSVSSFLAKELAIRISGSDLPKTDVCISYCPRNPINKRLAGYDQAKVLAEKVGKILKIPCLNLIGHASLSKVQKTLDKEERKKNAARSYALRPSAKGDLSGKAVILIDDISTTGSTLDRCAALLRKAGAGRIFYAYIARSNFRDSYDRPTAESEEKRKAENR